MRNVMWLAGCLLVMCLPLHAQVPPPPLMPGQEKVAAQLVRAIEGKDAVGYGQLLADDVVVSEDGKVIARGRSAWLELYGRKLSAKGVTFRMSSGYASTGRLLFVEFFDSAGSWGGAIPSHCCSSYDAVAYDIVDGKVAAIQRLRGGADSIVRLRDKPDR